MIWFSIAHQMWYAAEKKFHHEVLLMHAAANTFPHIGEWYSFDDLFHDFPDNWVLLAFPNGLTSDEQWDIMGTLGELIAIDPDREIIWQAKRVYKAVHSAVPTFLFATEQLEDDLVLIAGPMVRPSGDAHQ